MKKRVLSLVLVLVLVTALMVPSALATEYTDTEGHWGKGSIDRWSEAEIVVGVGGGLFEPNRSMTRAEGMQVFVKLFHMTGKADISAFTDVSEDAWYYNTVSTCVANEVTYGVATDQMDPNGEITREMFFTMFARALSIPQEEELEMDAADADQVSNWAKGAVFALANQGYVVGTSHDILTIEPQRAITRAEVMALLDDTIVAYVDENQTVEPERKGVVLIVTDEATVTGSEDATIVVAAEGAKVSLDGYQGEAMVLVLKNDVTVTAAPVGTIVTTAKNVTGTLVNGDAVEANTTVTVQEKPVDPSSSGTTNPSTSTGSSGTTNPSTSTGSSSTTDPSTSTGSSSTTDPSTSTGSSSTTGPSTSTGSSSTTGPNTSTGSSSTTGGNTTIGGDETTGG